ncbi:helix-turn-helix transcriptional regulator [Vaginisenegalia massiliensis]|uniref:helix-turn-helix transcriptional regulator n=1 Tax=Vaginisenegalia massiliensis TaxID=2058294 RepID=UPI000F5243CA|nr:helix-turn-helix transcriptional regulator [Vaginisenegalia massiliensis]
MKLSFGANLAFLRNQAHHSQEELAEHLQVSRQTISKWELGQTLPDIRSCLLIAELYRVSLDDLVNYRTTDSLLSLPNEGQHFFGLETVDSNGQICLPKEALNLLQLNPGEKLAVLMDENIKPLGVALVPEKALDNLDS